MEVSSEILIIEDDPDMRSLLSAALHRKSHTVMTAYNLSSARLVLTGQRFDVLICDMRLGDERGIDLLREQVEKLRACGTYTIVITAEDQYLEACEALDVDFFLTKPISIKMLLDLIERLNFSKQTQSA